MRRGDRYLTSTTENCCKVRRAIKSGPFRLLLILSTTAADPKAMAEFEQRAKDFYRAREAEAAEAAKANETAGKETTA